MSFRVYILLRKNMSRLLGLGLFQDSHEKGSLEKEIYVTYTGIVSSLTIMCY